MVPEELKRRISSLVRREGQASKLPAAPPRGRGSCPDLAECFPEGAVLTTARGEAFVCEVALEGIHSDAKRLREKYCATFLTAARMAEENVLPPYLQPMAEADVGAAALIDTETAGLHGRPLFMIGLGLYRGGDLTFVQYLARSYAEEAAILEEFAGLLPKLDLLISFNGKAFDWPFVRDRMAYHRISCRPSFAHLDLLHPSRRRWRSQLPNCKLQTLERYLCGRWRADDIPGDQIPQRYHDFVREQDARLVAPIFHHNRMDLITMIELLAALVGSEDGRPATSAGRPVRARERVRAAGGRGVEERSK